MQMIQATFSSKKLFLPVDGIRNLLLLLQGQLFFHLILIGRFRVRVSFACFFFSPGFVGLCFCFLTVVLLLVAPVLPVAVVYTESRAGVGVGAGVAATMGAAGAGCRRQTSCPQADSMFGHPWPQPEQLQAELGLDIFGINPLGHLYHLLGSGYL